jgi:CTP synthase (UTP-ammonia lyase)
VRLVPGSRAARLYGERHVVEDFRCRYGVDPAYREVFAPAGLEPTGFGDDGELRIVELRDHPFFVATLFVPQMRSTRERPHPLLRGFGDAVRAFAATRALAAGRSR